MQSPKEPETSITEPFVVSEKAWSPPPLPEKTTEPIPVDEPPSPIPATEKETVAGPSEIVTAQKQEEPQSATHPEPESLPEEPKEKTSFELQLGKVWFVRIGVVMVH